MIVVRLQGGLGNQMFQYAFGKALEKLGDETVLFEATSFADDCLRDLALRVWRVDLPLLVEDELVRMPRRYGGQGYLSLLSCRAPLNKISERPLGFHPRYLRPRKYSLMAGYWQDERFFAAAADEVRAHFRPADSVTKETADVVRRIESTNAVAVHVRRTDYIGHPTLQVCDEQHQSRCLDQLLSEVTGVTAFVFSDDLKWCRQHLRPACPTHYVGHTTGATAHEDLWMMSRCRHHVIPNSSFSWWSAYLKEDPSGQTFAPATWYTDPTYLGHNVAPARWRKVPGRVEAIPLARAA